MSKGWWCVVTFQSDVAKFANKQLHYWFSNASLPIFWTEPFLLPLQFSSRAGCKVDWKNFSSHLLTRRQWLYIWERGLSEVLSAPVTQLLCFLTARMERRKRERKEDGSWEWRGRHLFLSLPTKEAVAEAPSVARGAKWRGCFCFCQIKIWPFSYKFILCFISPMGFESIYLYLKILSCVFLQMTSTKPQCFHVATWKLFQLISMKLVL